MFIYGSRKEIEKTLLQGLVPYHWAVDQGNSWCNWSKGKTSENMGSGVVSKGASTRCPEAWKLTLRELLPKVVEVQIWNCYWVLMKRIVSVKGDIVLLKNSIVFKKNAIFIHSSLDHKWQKLSFDSLSKKAHKAWKEIEYSLEDWSYSIGPRA